MSAHDTRLDKSIRAATPRGGGYLKIATPTQYDTLEEELVVNCLCQANEGTETNDKDDQEWESAEDDTSYEYTGSTDINLLAYVISTVMLLASGHQPCEVQLKTVKAYLQCIKDDEGNTPPNVQGLLNHIQMNSPDETSSDDPDPDEQN